MGQCDSCQYLLHFWQLVEGKNLAPSIIFWRLSYSSDKILPVSLVLMLVNCRGSPVNSLHLRVKLLSNNPKITTQSLQIQWPAESQHLHKEPAVSSEMEVSDLVCSRGQSGKAAVLRGGGSVWQGTALELLLQRCPLCLFWRVLMSWFLMMSLNEIFLLVGLYCFDMDIDQPIMSCGNLAETSSQLKTD